MLGHADRLLTGGGVANKKDLLRLEEIAEALEFLDEGLIHFLTAGSIENLDISAGGFAPFKGLFAGTDDIRLPGFRSEDRH